MRGVAKFLYTHNPFYLISAAFVMYGLRQLFPSSSATQTDAWFLAQSLAGYSLLLAVTACLVVRLGKVWDDARTLALLVLLLCMAVSASFDDLALNKNSIAAQVLGFGFLFTVVLIELLKWGMGLRLSALFRLPLYVLMFLFFMFPVFLGDQIWSNSDTSMSWRVLLFPSLAAVGVLLLIPAARAGRELVDGNGSPWPWPLFPWSIFVIVGLGVVGRAYFLTLSFQTDAGLDSTFGTYYLVPFAFAVLLVVAEICLVAGAKRCLVWLAFTPGLLIVMACWHIGGGPYWQLLAKVTNHVGSPLFLTLHGSVLFTTYLWFRGVGQAKTTTIALLLTVCFVGPEAVQFNGFQVENWWPLWAIFGLQLWEYTRNPTSLRLMQTSLFLLTASWFSFDLSSAPSANAYAMILAHLFLIACLFACVLFEDQLAKYLRKLLPLAMFSLANAAIFLGWLGNLVPLFVFAYAGITCVLLFLQWRILRMRIWKWAAFMTTLMWVAYPSAIYLADLRHELPDHSFETLCIGAGCFLIGGWLSAIKGGLKFGSGKYLRREWQMLRLEWRHS